MVKNFIFKNKTDIIISIFLAIITGIIFCYPNFKIKDNILNDKDLSKNFIYSPLAANRIAPVNDELKYAAYIRKVMDGNLNIWDPNIYERRNNVNPTNKLPFVLAGIFSRWVGSVNQFLVLSDFVFPFFSIIIGCFFLRLFLENRLISFWGIIILLSQYGYSQLFNVLLFRFDASFAHLTNFKDAFNVFALKYPSYQFVFPFTFLVYYFCYKLLLKNSNRYLFITGVLVGLSSYIYIYSFLTLGLQLFFLMVWSFFQGKRILSLRLLLAGILALLISSFYLNELLSFRSSLAYNHHAMASGASKGIDYNIAFTSFKLIFLALLCLYLSWKISFLWHKVAFLLSITLPTLFLMVLSMHFFLIPQTQHFNTFEARNVGFLSLLFLISEILVKKRTKSFVPKKLFDWYKQKKNLDSCIKILFVAIIILHSSQIMASEWYYLHKNSSLYYPKYTINKHFVAAYDWLDKNVSKESVVLSIDEQQILLLPIFTGCYVYIPDSFISLCPGHEVWKRVGQGFGFYGVNKQILESILKGYELPHEYREEMIDFKVDNKYDLEKNQQAYVAYRKKWFPFIVFSWFAFDSNGLAFQYYRHYLSELELKRIEHNERGKSFYQGIYFIPSNLIKEQLIDYKSDSGNVDLLKYKVDYVWFGPLERDLTGLNEIKSNKLKLIFQNKEVTLYKVEE